MGEVSYRILLVEDCKKGMSRIYSEFLYSEYKNLHINLVTSIADADHRLEVEDFSAVLLAPNLPHYDGTSLVNYMSKNIKGIPLVVVLDGGNEGIEADVRKIPVEKIYRDGVINIKEIQEICEKYEGKRGVISQQRAEVLKEQERIANSAEHDTQNLNNEKTLQEEIMRHRDALLKARSESESSKEAALKAQQEAQALKEEANLAKEEAAKVREKVEELKKKNIEQSREIEESKAKVVSALQSEHKSEIALDESLSKVIEEKDSLARDTDDLKRIVSEKDAVVNKLNEDVNQLKSVIEELEQSRNDLGARLEASEKRGNAHLKEAQEALEISKRDQEEARVAYDSAKESQKSASEANRQRDAALESARIADERSRSAVEARDVALQKEAASLETQRKAEAHSVELSQRLEKSEKMVNNLNQVISTLEERCEELEAGQSALIEAEHVGIERERSAREFAEGELREVKGALVELEKIEQERAKLEELLKEGQIRENELVNEKTIELEKIIADESKQKSLLQDQIAALKVELESKEIENCRLLEQTKKQEGDVSEKEELLIAIKERVSVYKQTINELGKQREELERKYAEQCKEFEAKIKELLGNEEKVVALEEELLKTKEEAEKLRSEKDTIMESYTNKTEAVQNRLAESEKMLKECEWKLEQESSVKDLALERVMELGAFEDQVAQLELDISSEKEVAKGLRNQMLAQKEEITSLKNSEVELKNRMQLEILEKDMKVDSLSKELDELRVEYHDFKNVVLQEKDAIASNAQEVQNRLHETSDTLKTVQWEAEELKKENTILLDRVCELQKDEDIVGGLYQEIEELKSEIRKDEKRILVLNKENEDLSEKFESLKGLAGTIEMLQEKAELADKVASEIEDLQKALKEEQIEHRRLGVELRKSHERDSHLEELKNSNKELGWELMKARSLIGEYRAKEQERGFLGATYAESEVKRLRKELKSKEDILERIIAEKEAFTKEQLIKVAELTELYEKAQTDRLNLLEKLGREE